MRCERCDFENIPGQTRCVRCGSILEADGSVTDVHPPRMPAWQKPFRGVTRRLRGVRILPERSLLSRLPPAMQLALSNAATGLVLNVVPGLGCLIQGQFRKVRWLVLLWFVLLSAGLFLYGDPAGVFLIGLAIGVHAWTAVQSGLLKCITAFAERLGLVLLVVCILLVLYLMVPRIAGIGIVGARTVMEIPALHVRDGDYLLVRRVTDANNPLKRGTLVWTELHEYRRGYRNDYRGHGGFAIGQIAGLPGESISVRNNIFFAGDRRLDPNMFPVPAWLQQHPLKSGIQVPKDAYFVSSVYRATVRPGQVLTDEMIADVCIIEAADIRGRAFMRWLPLSRRGFIEYHE
jgi:hypothetical protein